MPSHLYSGPGNKQAKELAELFYVVVCLFVCLFVFSDIALRPECSHFIFEHSVCYIRPRSTRHS